MEDATPTRVTQIDNEKLATACDMLHSIVDRIDMSGPRKAEDKSIMQRSIRMIEEVISDSNSTRNVNSDLSPFLICETLRTSPDTSNASHAARSKSARIWPKRSRTRTRDLVAYICGNIVVFGLPTFVFTWVACAIFVKINTAFRKEYGLPYPQYEVSSFVQLYFDSLLPAWISLALNILPFGDQLTRLVSVVAHPMTLIPVVYKAIYCFEEDRVEMELRRRKHRLAWNLENWKSLKKEDIQFDD